MGNIWDLPGQTHLVHRRKKRKLIRHRPVQEPEEQLSSNVVQLTKTATDFMFAGASLGVIANLGTTLISSLKPK